MADSSLFAPLPPRLERRWIALGVVWLAAMLGGFGVLVDYSNRPGDPGRPVERWPASSGLGREAGRTELLLFAHALCPCTQSTLSELERVLARVAEPPRTRVVLWGDPARPEFSESRLRSRAESMPGVQVVEDPLGRLAEGFGARTSGMALLFDGRGRRVFAGGITPSRGHEGDSAGARAVVRLLNGELGDVADAPVFGCPLVTPDDEPCEAHA